MALTSYSRCRKVNQLTILKNQCFIAKNSTSETLLLGDSIIRGLNRYKESWYKYFPNSFNFCISEDRTENVLWRALNLPEISYLKNVIILCGTNNICIDSPYGIAQCLTDIGVCFRNHSTKVKIFISGIFPRDECYLVNRILIKEINAILKCKWTFHLFNLIEQEQGQTDSNHALDTLTFYQDKPQK